MDLIIPPEIWSRIGQFIPPDILRKLYSVNSVFLDLALNDKYSDISLAFCWTPRCDKWLKHLKKHHIAHRVKRLTLCSDWYELNLHIPLGHVPKTTCGMAIGLSFPFGLGFFYRTARNINVLKKCNEFMSSTVLNFPNVSSLSIVDCPGAFLQSGPGPLLVNAYTTCASNLRILSLNITTNNFTAFPPNTSDLTSLEEVRITFPPPLTFCTYPEATSDFLLAVASRITTLNITFCNADDLLQSFPQSKATFPKLKRFIFLHSGPDAAPTPRLVQFLGHHAHTLKHLWLQFTTQAPPHVVSESLGDLSLLHPLVLPHLESLDILRDSSFWSQILDSQQVNSHKSLDTARLFTQHSLTSLGLTYSPFTLHDLGILLDLLNAEGGGLKRLTIALVVLSPQILDMFAEKLPRLEKLVLSFEYLRSDAGNALATWAVGVRGEYLRPEVIESFLLEMKTRLYSRWSLTSFGFEHPRVNPYPVNNVLLKLAQCMPRLVEINGPVLMRRELGGPWYHDPLNTRGLV